MSIPAPPLSAIRDETVTSLQCRATRRRFTVEYKWAIVREADTCKTTGAIRALLRREGLYSSHLTTWRGARERGELAGMPKKRGPATIGSLRPLAREDCAQGREHQ
jgi:hypothetical protein